MSGCMHRPRAHFEPTEAPGMRRTPASAILNVAILDILSDGKHPVTGEVSFRAGLALRAQVISAQRWEAVWVQGCGRR